MTTNAYRTEDLTFKDNTCFVVRAYKNGAREDTNLAEKCTGHTRHRFAGVSELTLNTDGSWLVGWKRVPASDVTFTVYEREAGSTPFDLEKPKASGIKELSFTTANLTLNDSRCYLVRAESLSGKFEDDNTREMCTGHKAFGEFPGCTGYKIVDSSRIQIDFTRPAGASSFEVLRDGVVILKSEDAKVSQVLDSGLSNAREYKFECRATVNGLQKTGTTSYSLTPFNKSNLAAFDGCVSAEALATTQARVSFLWPTFAPRTVEQFRVYRNGVLVRTETDKSVTSFTDADLSEGQQAT